MTAAPAPSCLDDSARPCRLFIDLDDHIIHSMGPPNHSNVGIIRHMILYMDIYGLHGAFGIWQAVAIRAFTPHVWAPSQALLENHFCKICGFHGRRPLTWKHQPALAAVLPRPAPPALPAPRIPAALDEGRGIDTFFHNT